MLKKTEIYNVISQFFKINRFFVILGKVKKRIFSRNKISDKLAMINWLENNLTDISLFSKSIDSELWDESLGISKEISNFAKSKLEFIRHDLGGGGAYPFLYFLTRYLQPKVIVETGVASGYSSAAFLQAIYKNKRGVLYSSDFPYFRLSNPEQYIGIVVEDYLKRNWNLYIEGDENNLKKIKLEIANLYNNRIDIFHYDSDKRYISKKNCLKNLQDCFSRNTLILIDDIQDNYFFKDYIQNNKIKHWKVFKFQNKYFGLIGKLF